VKKSIQRELAKRLQKLNNPLFNRWNYVLERHLIGVMIAKALIEHYKDTIIDNKI
jgi:hypothetical protein